MIGDDSKMSLDPDGMTMTTSSPSSLPVTCTDKISTTFGDTIVDATLETTVIHRKAARLHPSLHLSHNENHSVNTIKNVNNPDGECFSQNETNNARAHQDVIQREHGFHDETKRANDTNSSDNEETSTICRRRHWIIRKYKQYARYVIRMIYVCLYLCACVRVFVCACAIQFIVRL
jgi:hypothetical protein